MKFLMKLVILAVVIAALLPVVLPGAPVSQVVRAAIADITGFCDRNPTTCAQGQQIALRTGDIITRALRALTEDAAPATLTAEDRTLAPATATAPSPTTARATAPSAAAPAQQPAFATNGGLNQP